MCTSIDCSLVDVICCLLSVDATAVVELYGLGRGASLAVVAFCKYDGNAGKMEGTTFSRKRTEHTLVQSTSTSRKCFVQSIAAGDGTKFFSANSCRRMGSFGNLHEIHKHRMFT